MLKEEKRERKRDRNERDSFTGDKTLVLKQKTSMP